MPRSSRAEENDSLDQGWLFVSPVGMLLLRQEVAGFWLQLSRPLCQKIRRIRIVQISPPAPPEPFSHPKYFDQQRPADLRLTIAAAIP